jgi:predicted ATP-binding protein involved in virulence
MLEEVEISLEKQTTVISRRNNSGKTSLAELFRRLLSENSNFRSRDFFPECSREILGGLYS